MTANKLDNLLNKAVANGDIEPKKGKLKSVSHAGSQGVKPAGEKAKTQVKKPPQEISKGAKSKRLDEQLKEAEKRLKNQSYKEAIKFSMVEMASVILAFYIFHDLGMLSVGHYKLFTAIFIPAILIRYYGKKKLRHGGLSMGFAGGNATWFAIFGSLCAGFLRYVVLVPVIQTNIPQEILWLSALFCGVIGVSCYYVIVETLIYKLDRRFGRK